MVDALTAEIEPVRPDDEFMAKLRELTERDREILDRLAERHRDASAARAIRCKSGAGQTSGSGAREGCSATMPE